MTLGGDSDILKVTGKTLENRTTLDRLVDRVKPGFMVHGLVHGSWFMVLFMVSFMDDTILVSAPVPLELILIWV